ncbi:MAG TPA: winged helix DNA-binding domain-containing protein [Actinomycetes bacterium]|nr:winged helix DNA-binding domain-containing protein [Actinomycetes bacterium]
MARTTMSTELTASDALALRMHNLVLGAEYPAEGLDSVGALARWFGAMQAQDLASLQWSLGLRLETTLAEVEAELEKGEALRTWPMRGTIHLVPAEDAASMVRVLGERPLSEAGRRREYLGLSLADADRAAELLGEALAGGGRLTRAECIAVLEAGGVSGAGQRGYHLLWYASQRGVTCIAPSVDGEQTFVLLDEWVDARGGPRELDRDEALGELALRYFQSHGPAPRKDFAGWAGLTAKDTKTAIAECGDALSEVSVDGVEMIASTESLDALPDLEVGGGAGWLALPGFDEYLLGYKDRSLMIDAAGMKGVIPGGNGVFRATLVREGQVMATWKRTLTPKAVKVEVFPLKRVSKAQQKQAAAALEPYADYLERDLQVTWA